MFLGGSSIPTGSRRRRSPTRTDPGARRGRRGRDVCARDVRRWATIPLGGNADRARARPDAGFARPHRRSSEAHPCSVYRRRRNHHHRDHPGLDTNAGRPRTANTTSLGHAIGTAAERGGADHAHCLGVSHAAVRDRRRPLGPARGFGTRPWRTTPIGPAITRETDPVLRPARPPAERPSRPHPAEHVRSGQSLHSARVSRPERPPVRLKDDRHHHRSPTPAAPRQPSEAAGRPGTRPPRHPNTPPTGTTATTTVAGPHLPRARPGAPRARTGPSRRRRPHPPPPVAIRLDDPPTLLVSILGRQSESSPRCLSTLSPVLGPANATVSTHAP
jgi:hypothetical protein